MLLNNKVNKILRSSFRKKSDDLLEVKNPIFSAIKMVGWITIICFYVMTISWPQGSNFVVGFLNGFKQDYENIKIMVSPDYIIIPEYEKELEFYNGQIATKEEEDGAEPYPQYKEWFISAHPSYFKAGYYTIAFYLLFFFWLLLPNAKPVRIDRKRRLVYKRLFWKYSIEQSDNPTELLSFLNRSNQLPKKYILGLPSWRGVGLDLDYYNEYGKRKYVECGIGVWPSMDVKQQEDILYKTIEDFLNYKDNSEYLTQIDNKFHTPFLLRWLLTRTLFFGGDNYSEKEVKQKVTEQLERKTKYDEIHEDSHDYVKKIAEVIALKAKNGAI